MLGEAGYHSPDGGGNTCRWAGQRQHRLHRILPIPPKIQLHVVPPPSEEASRARRWRRWRPWIEGHQAEGIDPVHRVVFDIGVVVDSTLKPNGVFTEESPDLGVVVSSSVVVEPRLGIPLPAREGIS